MARNPKRAMTFPRLPFMAGAAAVLGAIVLALPPPVGAVLGEDATSVARDQTHMKSTLSVAPTENAIVHELRLASGTVVREYAAPRGAVFAVAWQGPWLPDLRQLLGTYFEQYANAAQARRRAHAPVVIHEPGLVVEIGGHMRAFVGRAYVPELIPAAVEMDAIR